MLARVGKQEYPGTIAFHGPFTLIDHEQEKTCAYFYDSEGFHTDATSKQRVKYACKMMLGKVRAGQTLQQKGVEQKIFLPVSHRQFKGADIVIVVADGSKGKDALKSAVHFENRLRVKCRLILSLSFSHAHTAIRTMLVVTRAEGNEEVITEALACRADDWVMMNNYMMQYNPERQLFEPPEPDPVKDLKFLKLYAQMLSTIESGPILVPTKKILAAKAWRVCKRIYPYLPIIVVLALVAVIIWQ